MILEKLLVQISVIVAIFSNGLRSSSFSRGYIALKTDVGKVSLPIAIRQGSVGPKCLVST